MSLSRSIEALASLPAYITDSIAKEGIAALPLYDIEPRSIIQVPYEDVPYICNEVIAKCPFVGFDTESKPAFRKQHYPELAIIQIATPDTVYIFHIDHLRDYGVIRFLNNILANPSIIKVGFGLKSDRSELREYGISLNGVVDLVGVFRALGRRETMGAKQAIALMFAKQLQKSKKVTTSNWKALPLTEHQIRYAGEDAAAPLACFEMLRRDLEPIRDSLPASVVEALGWGKTQNAKDTVANG